jgi:hypothetical protein
LFVVTTVINYVWQIPYYLHFYGSHRRAPAPLAVLLLVTFAWFVVAAVLLFRGKRGGFTWMVSFLVVEVGFYFVHNASGAFLLDLVTSDAILWIAAALGYVNTLAGVVLLMHMVRHRRDPRSAAGDAVWSDHAGSGACPDQQPAGAITGTRIFERRSHDGRK